jgi:N4-gp56 family major capsid protein
MAFEVTTTTATDLVYANMIEEAVLEEIRATMVMTKFMRKKSLAGLPTKRIDFPKWPLVTAASVNEATDLTNTAVNTTDVYVQAGEVGIMATVTDVLEKSDILEGLGGYKGVLARAVSAKIDADCTALLGALNGGVAAGTSGTNLRYTEDWLAALAICENNNAHTTGELVCVLHTQQAADLRVSLGASAGVLMTDFSDRSKFYSNSQGWFGRMHDVDIWTSTHVPAANSNADRAGGFFSKEYALGLATKWPLRVELQRDASLRATEIVVTSMYGVGEIEDQAGVPLVTDL